MSGWAVIPAADVWAVAGALAASLALGLRGNLLKPSARTWVDAPCLVFLSIMAVSIVMLGIALSILSGRHAQPREAIAYCTLALASWAMLINLWRQRGADPRPSGPA